MDIKAVKFDKEGLVPAIAQDAATGAVLMQAYMNAEALEKTLATGQAHYWSRSRKKLWRKGEESGHTQSVAKAFYDCDGDSILLQVVQTGPACHTGNQTCFFNEMKVNRQSTDGDKSVSASGKRRFWAEEAYCDVRDEAENPSFRGDHALFAPSAVLYDIAATIKDRKANPQAGSYTNYLFDKGVDKICKKVGEEASETIIAAKNKDNVEMANEISDLLFHLLVLCENQGLEIDGVFKVLAERHAAPRKKEYK